MKVLIFKKESQSQVAGHVTIGLVCALLCNPSFVLQALLFFIFEFFVLLKHQGVCLRLVFFNKFEVVTGLILVNIDV